MSEAEEGAAEAAEENNAEHDASLLGWSEKENWRGDDGNWVDAETFLERGKQINPILRKNNEKLMTQISSLESRLIEQSQTFKKFTDHERSKHNRDIQSKVDALVQEKVEAINEGDGQRVVKIEEQITKESQSYQQAPPPQADTPNPEFVAWREKNEWVNDKENGAIATAVGYTLAEEQPNLQGADFYEEVKRRVFEKIPSLNANPRKERPSQVDGAKPASQKSGKSFSDLPADAQATAKRFEAEGLMKIDEYVKEYEWEQ